MEAARIVSRPDTVVCKAGANLDFRTTEAFKSLADRLVELGARNFIIDFSGTAVLDSAGLGSILTLHRRLQIRGGRILFASPSPAVRTVLGITKCDRVFGSYPSVPVALLALPAVAAQTEAQAAA